MTATTANPAAPSRTGRPTATPVTFPRVVAAEWLKFRSLRSTVWTLAVTVALMVGISVLMAWGSTTLPPEANQAGMSTATIMTASWYFAQLAIAVLGVLVITGEYSTGMIRSTLAAVPRRTAALWAKAVVVAVVTLVVTLVAEVLAYVATMPFHDELGATLDLSSGETLRLVLGTPLLLATIGLLAFAIGALLRHSAAALATVLGLLLVVENVFAALPLAFFETVSPFLPSTAGGRLVMDAQQVEMSADFSDAVQLTPWQGYGVLVAWVVVLLGTAAVLLRRRDA